MPTELPDVIDHFLCKICRLVVYQPKECSRCASLYCFDCSNNLISKNSKWQCVDKKCNSQDPLVEIHRTVKEVMEKLVFSCPKCGGNKRTYNEMVKHIPVCDGANADSAQDVVIENIRKAETQQAIQQQIQPAQAIQYTEILIHIMEKDSKKFYIFNSRTQQVTSHEVNCLTNFPHNFQAIQIGLVQTRVFIVGGGDFNSVPETMFQMNEIVKSGPSYALQQKQKMKYPRHGHSCCTLGETFIFVTGSRKDTDKAPNKTEMYDTRQDAWVELAMFNQGRHYHSSCSFQSKFVYIFCGISNETKKYLNSIERLEFDPNSIQNSLKKTWVKLEIANMALLQPRQGSGVCQVNDNEILIVGGFCGQFSNETFFLNTQTNSIRKAYNELKDNIFPFQVPTIADPLNRSVYTVDWQTYKLYQFKNDQWQFQKKIKI
eukprot:403371155